MIYLKAAIFTTIFLVFTMLGYMFLTFDSHYELNNAQDLFLKEQFSQAEKSLRKVQDAIPEREFHLYLGYIRRAQDRLDESTEQLERSAFLTTYQRPSPVLLEIHLNRCLNAYLENKTDVLSSVVEEVYKAFPGDKWVDLYSGLSAFLKEDYETALKNWASSEGRLPLSPWMKKAFEEVFTPFWETIHLSRCQIETGNFLFARQRLEKQIEHSSAEEQTHIHRLLGLSYAQEAQSKPFSAAAPYYKLALSHFRQTPIQQERYDSLREQVLAKIEGTISDLLTNHSFSDIAFYASVYKEWNAKERLKVLNNQLISMLNEELDSEDQTYVQQLAVILNHVLTDKTEREVLSKRFTSLIQRLLQSQDIFKASRYWAVAAAFSTDSDALASRIIDVVREKILVFLPKDTAELTQSRPYLSFWQKLEKTPSERLAFAHSLVQVSAKMWLEEAQERKALNIMKLVLALPFSDEEGQALQKEIASAIHKAYLHVSREDQIDKLPTLLEAVRSFQLTGLGIQDEKATAEHLKEAYQLFEREEYQGAKKRAQWVLHIDNNNLKAHRLIGLIAYQEGDYPQAATSLSLLPDASEEILEAQAVSNYLGNDKEVGRQKIQQFRERYRLSDQAMLRLGLESVSQHDPISGLEWLSQLSNPNDEIYAGRCMAKLFLKDWEGALEDWKNLTHPYNQLDGLCGIPVQAAAAKGNLDNAEQMLNQLLTSKKPNIDPSEFSPAFHLFHKKTLGLMNRHYLAGVYELETKNQPEEALRHLERIENPRGIQLLTKGKLYLQLGHFEKARDNLEQFTKASRRTSEERAEALPLLGRCYLRLHRHFDAVKCYRDFYEINPENISYRNEYANVLIKLRLYNRALQEYLTYRKQHTLSWDDRISYIRCLVHTEHFEEAIEQTHLWTFDDPPPPLLHQLSLARLMVIVKAPQLIFPVLEKIKDPLALDFKEKEELIQLYLAIGRYDQAKALADSMQEQLNKNSQGLLLQARLHEFISDLDETLKLAHRAIELDPNNPAIVEIIDRNDPTISRLVSEANELRKQLRNKNQSVVALRTAYCRKIGYLAIATQRKGIKLSPLMVAELKDAYYMLDKLTAQGLEYPEIYFLMGQLMGFAGKDQQAVDAYKAAINLDSSYPKALRYLAIATVNKNYFSATKMLKKAGQYDPTDNETWLSLGHIYMATQDFFEAKVNLINAIKSKPNDPRAYIYMGRVLQELKNPEDAKISLEKALSLAPENIPALKLLLISLYDPHLRISPEKHRELRQQRTEVLQQLRKLAPRRS